MLTILNEAFTYDCSRQVFINEIITLRYNTYVEGVYEFISALSKPIIMSSANEHSSCILCRRIIRKRESTRYSGYTLHSKCFTVIERMVNNNPIATVKLVISGNNIETLPLYGCFEGRVFARKGSVMEIWNIVLDVYDRSENIYNSICAPTEIVYDGGCGR